VTVAVTVTAAKRGGRRVAPSFPQDRGNPDAKDGNTRPHLVMPEGRKACPVPRHGVGSECDHIFHLSGISRIERKVAGNHETPAQKTAGVTVDGPAGVTVEVDRGADPFGHARSLLSGRAADDAQRTARSAVIPAGPRESRRQGRQHAAPPRPRIANLLHTARTHLAAGTGDGTGANADDPHRDAEILLTHATGLTVAAQVANPNRRVPPAQAEAYRELVRRRATGEPIAYLTGRKEFWSMELTVTPAVLIPRPETELLVELALEFARRRGHDKLRILELGSGSGALALALATELPASRITATDSSPAAIEIARTNHRRLSNPAADNTGGDGLSLIPI